MSQSEQVGLAGSPQPLQISGGYERFRRAWVQVTGPAALAGRSVEVREGQQRRGEIRLESDSGRASGRLELPMPPPGQPYGAFTVALDGHVIGQYRLPDPAAARLDAFRAAELHFAPYVFAGPRFPACEFAQPSLVEDLIGRYTLRATFYDAEYRPVTSAERPGRYGAVIQIEAPGGPPVSGADPRLFRRFRTLFRQPEPAGGWRFSPAPPNPRMSQPEPVWYGKKEPLPLELPPALGIDPEAVREQGTGLHEYFRARWRAGCWDDPWTPVLLAGLFETAAGSGDLRRLNVWERDRRWWWGLKQRTGDARTPHLLYLPAGYDGDPEKRWPLVLFLHGSGEIGEDLDQVRKCGLPKRAEEGQSFPFLVVAPQSPPEEWFWLAAAQETLLEEICARYRVDPDRIYATGFSMGGRGTWVQAIEYPDRFAAIAPICGSIPEPEEARRIRHVPVWAFVGAQDGDQSIRQMVEAHQAAGGDARLTVYPDAGHDAWTPAYADPALYDWLLSHRRAPSRS
jgi:predicted esterase